MAERARRVLQSRAMYVFKSLLPILEEPARRDLNAHIDICKRKGLALYRILQMYSSVYAIQ